MPRNVPANPTAPGIARRVVAPTFGNVRIVGVIIRTFPPPVAAAGGNQTRGHAAG